MKPHTKIKLVGINKKLVDIISKSYEVFEFAQAWGIDKGEKYYRVWFDYSSPITITTRKISKDDCEDNYRSVDLTEALCSAIRCIKLTPFL